MGQLSEHDKVRAITLFKYSHWNQKMIAKELGCSRSGTRQEGICWPARRGTTSRRPARPQVHNTFVDFEDHLAQHVAGKGPEAFSSM